MGAQGVGELLCNVHKQQKTPLRGTSLGGVGRSTCACPRGYGTIGFCLCPRQASVELEFCRGCRVALFNCAAKGAEALLRLSLRLHFLLHVMFGKLPVLIRAVSSSRMHITGIDAAL